MFARHCVFKHDLKNHTKIMELQPLGTFIAISKHVRMLKLYFGVPGVPRPYLIDPTERNLCCL